MINDYSSNPRRENCASVTEKRCKDTIFPAKIKNVFLVKREEAYASDIMEALKQADMIVVEGTLYPLMTRLKNAALLNYSWRESTAGPPRKYYTLTDKGNDFLREALASWNELQTMITKLI